MKEISVLGSRYAALRRLAVVTAGLAAYALLTAVLYRRLRPTSPVAPATMTVVQSSRPPTRNLAVRDGAFWVDGARFVVRGVGWDPVRPGEVPWQRAFARSELDADLARIAAAGFNTVRTWAPLTAEELELVARHRLRVLQGIWVAPDGDFADPAFRRRSLGEVTRAVEGSRWSPALLGYIVLNEPRASAVARAGLDETRGYLREVVATVRALDPSAPIGYASWPGMEALDDPLLDFVAFNVYPHRPRVVMDELGLAGYVALLRRTIARGRPLLISEFGISVSPGQPVPGRGGASEDEQASGLVDLASTFVGAGADGLVVFQWSDGWWKNGDGAGDELRHDPDDPEEWFGLIRFRALDDREGQPRPALAALATYQRAVLIEPRAGQVAGDPVPVLIAADQEVRLEVSVSGAPLHPVELWAAGPGLWEGKLFLPSRSEREEVTFVLRDVGGHELRRESRLVRTGAARGRTLALTPARLTVAPGASFTVEAQATGPGVAGVSISVATFTEDRYNEERRQVRADERGAVRVVLRAPDAPTLLTVIAFEDDPALPPAERAAAWMVVEVGAR